jgi:hypothetical protein
MNNNNSSAIINEQLLVPISELPFQYNNSVISTIEAIEKKEKEKMVKTRKQKREEEKNMTSNQHSIEKWFSPKSKKKISNKNNRNLENEKLTVIDLTEISDTESKDSEATVVVLQEEEVTSPNAKKNSLTPKKSINNMNKIEDEIQLINENNVIKSPYFKGKKKEV